MTEARSDRAGLMTAGQFADATLLSAKALRLYAERGLLPPRTVDPVNGYRYYGGDQVPTGWLIALLRSADVSLNEIADIVGASPDDGLTLLDQVAAAAGRRAVSNRVVLARARLHLEGKSTMNEPITRIEQDRPVLSVLRRVRPQELDAVISHETDELRRLAAAAGLVVTGDAFGIFHAPVTDESNGPLEIALPVDGLLPEDAQPDGDLRSYRLSGGQVAERVAEGAETDFPGILALYDEVHGWISSGGRVAVGPPREIWHSAPVDTEPLRLTISWPYATAS